MSNILILNLQIAMAFGAYIVIFRVYLRSCFAAQPFEKAVLPLLLLVPFILFLLLKAKASAHGDYWSSIILWARSDCCGAAK
ncbi:MAG: hypothetical protein ACI9ZV_000745 [Candidatus Azotimanducaceae bacterium]|jgi:hypothetical protein